jgi:hypothetical protein
MHCFCFSADKTLLAIGSGAQNIVRMWELPATEEAAEDANDGGETSTASKGPSREDAPAMPEAETEPKTAERSDVASKKAMRTWTSADGKFTVRAQFVKAIAGTVHLHLEDGRTIRVPMEKLSEDDRRSLRQ